jgi:hypothetical protein
MNERDFDKLFSDKLNEEDKYPNKDSVKRSVFTRLDTTLPAGDRQPNFLKSAWLLPFLCLFLAWSGYQFFQIKDLKQENKDLKTAIQKIVVAPTMTLKNDTIYKSTIVYKTDTIYKRVYVIENILPKNTVSEKIDYSKKGISAIEKTDYQQVKINTPSVFDSKIQENRVNAIIDNKTIGNQANNKPLKTGLPIINKNKDDNLDIALVSKPSDTLHSNVIHKDNIVENNKADATKKLQDTTSLKDITQLKEQPKDSVVQVFSEGSILKSEEDLIPPIIQKQGLGAISIGIQGGATLSSYSRRDMNTSKILGISGEYALNNKWHIQFNTDIGELRFKSFDKLRSLNIPEIAAPNSQYVFKYVEGHQKSVYLGLGLNYMLRSKGWLRPFVSAGYLYQYIPDFKADYEFINPTTGQKLTISREIAHNSNHFTYIGLGSNIPIYKKLSARLKVDYGFELTEKHHEGALILRGGIFYRF